MREKRTVQTSIFEQYAEHEIGRELKVMSAWLDTQPELLDWVAADVKQRNVEETGRKGLSIESVLRCAILKQYRQLSYEELVFCLMDKWPLCAIFTVDPLERPIFVAGNAPVERRIRTPKNAKERTYVFRSRNRLS